MGYGRVIGKHKDTFGVLLMNSVPNSFVLMFVRGWQGGTVHDIARTELGTTVTDVINADLERMTELMRLAQNKRHRASAPFLSVPYGNRTGYYIEERDRG